MSCHSRSRSISRGGMGKSASGYVLPTVLLSAGVSSIIGATVIGTSWDSEPFFAEKYSLERFDKIRVEKEQFSQYAARQGTRGPVCDSKVSYDPPSGDHDASSDIHTDDSSSHDSESMTHDTESAVHCGSSDTHQSVSTMHDGNSLTHKNNSNTHNEASTVHAYYSFTHEQNSDSHSAASDSHTGASDAHLGTSDSHSAESAVHHASSSTHSVLFTTMLDILDPVGG